MMDSETAPAADPLDWFRRWYDEARSVMQGGAEVIALATADCAGAPSVRFVHFKGLQSDGFVFYTNYGSRKALAIAANPLVALAFHWAPLRRQVRVEGRCSRLDRATSERYFAQRDRETQLTSAASTQSAEMPSFDVLTERIEKLRAAHTDQEIPCPAGWGGLVVKPQRMEFWQGQEHRRHRRWQYVRDGDNWKVRLLFP